MKAFESLRNRSGMLVGGLISFLIVLAAFRWWSGDPVVQPSGDVGILIGAALVALYFVMSDLRASSPSVKPGRARELN